MLIKKYSVMVFDLGNVLIPFSYDIAIKRFNEIEAGKGDSFYQFFKNNYNLHRNFERGDFTEDYFINKILNEINFKIDKETFCKIYSEIFSLNENVIALLPELKKNYKLVLLSNTNPIHHKYGWAKYNFISLFDKLILSHEVKAVKPEEKIYKAVEDWTSLPANEHVFIDDILDYVISAQNLNWDGIHFTNYDKLLADLKQRNIL